MYCLQVAPLLALPRMLRLDLYLLRGAGETYRWGLDSFVISNILLDLQFPCLCLCGCVLEAGWPGGWEGGFCVAHLLCGVEM